MTSQTIATATKFRIALRVADLPRAIPFYRLLLKCEPVQRSAASVLFEPDQPALALTLMQGELRTPESTLNHLGIRMPDQAALVDLQRRLEEGGIATQRQEGVECCYALQTKFWVTDPDKHLWELYIFHEDLDHSGFDDVKEHPWKPKSDPKFWTHPLTDPIPARLEFSDGSLDEVNLEGTFNARLDTAVKTRLLAEIFRVLRPGGTVAIHGMASDRPFPGVPAFPGIAALVQHVPVHSELSQTLREAGFVNLFLEKFDGICLSAPGVELREIRLVGTRPDNKTPTGTYHVLYRGPFDEAINDDGVIYHRGERTAVNERAWTCLRQGLAADQFMFFPIGNKTLQG